MSSKLLQLSLYVLTVIQLTSSATTYDVVQHLNYSSCCSCGNTEQMLNQLMAAVLPLQTTVSGLQSSNSQIKKDVAVIKAKATVMHKNVTDKPKLRQQKGKMLQDVTHLVFFYNFSFYFVHFYQRGSIASCASAGIARREMSVHLFVCPSHSGIVSKRR